MKKGLTLFSSLILLLVSALAIAGVVIVAALLTIPDITQLEKCFTTTMFQVRLCPGSDKYVALKEVSPYMVHAVIAAEDGSFYQHKGFDWHEMEESLTANLRSGKIRRGGSTLTQQLAKNAFLTQDKSYWRKIKEAYLAYAIEQKFSKSFILEKYLNVVEFGPGLYGVKRASQHYFHKHPSDLNPLQSAYLAHLLPNPKVYSQGSRTGTLTPFSRKMVAIILKRMASFGKLSADGYQLAMLQVPNFPWTGLGRDAFSGAPSYALETSAPADGAMVAEPDSATDEEALEELLKELSHEDSTEEM